MKQTKTQLRAERDHLARTVDVQRTIINSQQATIAAHREAVESLQQTTALKERSILALENQIFVLDNMLAKLGVEPWPRADKQRDEPEIGIAKRRKAGDGAG
jgi:hypothetical protein